MPACRFHAWRFVLRFHLPEEIASGCTAYVITREKWVSCMGAQIGLRQPHGTGNDVEMEQVHKWRQTTANAEREMKDAGGVTGKRLALQLLVDEVDVEPKTVKQRQAVIAALTACARSMGKIIK